MGSGVGEGAQCKPIRNWEYQADRLAEEIVRAIANDAKVDTKLKAIAYVGRLLRITHFACHGVQRQLEGMTVASDEQNEGFINDALAGNC